MIQMEGCIFGIEISQKLISQNTKMHFSLIQYGKQFTFQTVSSDLKLDDTEHRPLAFSSVFFCHNKRYDHANINK